MPMSPDGVEYDLDDLISSIEAGRLLGVCRDTVRNRKDAGFISFSILLPSIDPNNKVNSKTRYYSKKEIEAIVKSTLVDPDDADCIDWSEVISITALSKRSILDMVKRKDFPANVRQTKGISTRRYSFSRKAVLKWLGDHGEDIPEKGRLLNSSEACRLSGYSWPTLRKYIQSGALHYAYRNQSPVRIPSLNNLPGSSLGQGYWFTKKEVMRWKKEIDNKMSSSNRWKNQEKRKGGAPGMSTTSDPLVSNPDRVKSQNVVLDEDILGDYKNCSDKELTLRVLEGGEKAIYESLCSMKSLAPYDLYYLINSMQYGKKEWRHLDSASKSQYSLKILRRAEEMLCAMLEIGTEFKPYDLNYMLRTEVMIQEERRRIAKTEVGQTGVSSDEILEEVAVG